MYVFCNVMKKDEREEKFQSSLSSCVFVSTELADMSRSISLMRSDLA